MKISGLQKLTALDFPDKLACTVFTAGCNLRCPFCHNASLVLRNDGEQITLTEFFDFLKKRQGVLDGVCITGGEPLLQSDISDFMREIKKLGFEIKLDTNGAFPKRLLPIIEDSLVDYVAMDIKNCPEKYPQTCGIEADWQEFFSPFKESIDILLQNKVDFEFRTTVTNELHTLNDIEKIGETIKGAKNLYLQCFKDSGDLISANISPPSREKIYKMRDIAQKYVQNCSVRGI